MILSGLRQLTRQDRQFFWVFAESWLSDWSATPSGLRERRRPRSRLGWRSCCSSPRSRGLPTWPRAFERDVTAARISGSPSTTPGRSCSRCWLPRTRCTPFPLPSPGLERPVTLVLPVVGVIVEEIVFRPLLIRALQRALAARRRPLLWAVVVGTLLWAAMHLPSYPLAQVVGGPILGACCLARYMRSPEQRNGFVVHASANAGGVGSAVVLVLYLLLAVLLRKRPVQGEATPSSPW